MTCRTQRGASRSGAACICTRRTRWWNERPLPTCAPSTWMTWPGRHTAPLLGNLPLLERPRAIFVGMMLTGTLTAWQLSADATGCFPLHHECLLLALHIMQVLARSMVMHSGRCSVAALVFDRHDWDDTVMEVEHVGHPGCSGGESCVVAYR